MTTPSVGASVLRYFTLACAISWLGWAPQILGSRGIAPFDLPLFQAFLLLAATGPLIAALLVARGLAPGGPRWLLVPIRAWRDRGRWIGVAIALPLTIFALAALLDGGGRDLALDPSPPLLTLLPLLLVNLIQNGMEEIGWRGFALPQLQRATTPLVASLLVGLMWGVWHLPLFLIEGHPFQEVPFLFWLVGVVAQSLFYTWLYNGARGSLLVVTLLHATINTVGALLYTGSLGAVTVASLLVAGALLVSPARHALLERSGVTWPVIGARR